MPPNVQRHVGFTAPLKNKRTPQEIFNAYAIANAKKKANNTAKTQNTTKNLSTQVKKNYTINIMNHEEAMKRIRNAWNSNGNVINLTRPAEPDRNKKGRIIPPMPMYAPPAPPHRNNTGKVQLKSLNKGNLILGRSAAFKVSIPSFKNLHESMAKGGKRRTRRQRK